MDVIVVAAAHNMTPAQRQGTGSKGAAGRSAVLRYLLVRPDVEEARRLVLTSRPESISTGMELRTEIGKVVIKVVTKRGEALSAQLGKALFQLFPASFN